MTDDAWMADADYAYLSELDEAALSWELLRRHPEYRRDFAQLADKEAPIAPAVPGDGARDWGLVFRRGPRADVRPAAGLLATVALRADGLARAGAT